jgi:hypothetical protein
MTCIDCGIKTNIGTFDSNDFVPATREKSFRCLACSTQRTCEECGTRFEPGYAAQVFCSTFCAIGKET